MRFSSVLLSLTATLVAAGPLSTGKLAPLYTPPNPADVSATGSTSHLVPDSYIVVLKKGSEAHEHQQWVQAAHTRDVTSRIDTLGAYANADLGGVVHSYGIGALQGYSGKFSQEVLHQIRSRPDVAYVERDSIVWASDLEKGAPWGLARLSHRKSLGFGTFNKYEYEHEGGAGVTAYVIDTGVNVKHVELEGRAVWGKTIPLNDQDIDANGHGSHVAGTIGSKKYGVAKKVKIVAVKVLGSNGSGTMSDVVAGVDWAAKHAAAEAAAARASANSTHKGSVANMSLGGGKSIALDEAVNNAVETGLHFAVAAGNDNRDACTFSPAAASAPITVGASAINDARAYFSNHGKCVDVFAPGLNILSIWNSGNTSVNTISGTSMASPHVAGLAAYFLSLYPKTFSPTSEDYLAAGVESPFEAPQFGSVGRHTQSIFNYVKELVGLPISKPEPALKGKHPDELHPKVLKKALIRVATSGILTDLPEHTVNALIYNNFTAI